MRIRIVSRPMDPRSVTPDELQDQWQGVELEGAFLCAPVDDVANTLIKPENVKLFYAVENKSLPAQLSNQRPELQHWLQEKILESRSEVKLMLFPKNCAEIIQE